MPFDPEPYARGLRERNARERALIARRASEAREEASRLASEIAARDSDVRAVYLFGSLAAGEPARIGFDIDLALDGGDLYRALEVAERSRFDVDVISIDRVSQEMRDVIESGGKVLFRRDAR